MWNTPEKGDWKTGAVGIGSSEACMLGGVAAWLRWRERRKAAGKPYDKPNLVMSTALYHSSSTQCVSLHGETRQRSLHLSIGKNRKSRDL